MRRNILLCITTTALLSSCAYQGVVTEKRFRPVPFSASLGVDAMYNFQLRDNAGQTNSQMVTPDVFATYRVGDYFNDMQEPPVREEKELEGFRLPPPELREGPNEPVRVMQMQKAGINVAVAHDRGEDTLRIPRWQTVRVVQLQSPERIVAKVAIPAQDRVERASRISRLQTVKIVALHAPQTTRLRVTAQTPGPVEDVKILRWQTVRIVQTQPSAATTAKAALKPTHRAKAATKTAASHGRSQHGTRIVRDLKKGTKIAGTHHRKAVASLN